MKTLINYLFLLSITILLLTSCKKEDETPAPVDNPPVANAGNDASITVGLKVDLDGSNSTDPDGKALTYSWTIKAKPEGSTANLNKANEVKAEFTPDQAGSFVFELTVNNSKKTAKDEVVITATSAPYTGCINVTENITVATVWKKIAPQGNVDYCISTDLYVNADLTIEPGVIIEFAEGKKMLIDHNEAAIKAIGTESNRIIFTGKEKIKGYWKGIEMNNAQNDDNEFNYVTFSYAGSGNHVTGFKAALSVRNASHISIKNSIFDNNAGYGLVIPSGKIVEFSQNTFSNNTAAGLNITSNLLGKLDNQTKLVGGNGREGVEVEGSNINEDNEQILPAFNDGGKLYILDNLYIYSGVKIQEGAILEFKADKGIVVDGSGAYLQAKGSANNKIVFSGIDKEKGSWKGIEFSSTTNSKNEFDHCEIQYAGGITHVSGYKAGISSRNNSEFKLTNCIISNSKGYGVAIYNGNFTEFENNVFSNNVSAAMIVPPNVAGKLDRNSKFKGENGREGIEIKMGTVNFDNEQVWPAFDDGGKYFIMENIYINTGVKIEEGAVLEFNADKGFTVSGSGSYLFARGTAEKKIIFTGIDKSKGYWKGIEFNSSTSSKNEFNHVEISYAGSSNHVNGYKSNISLRNSSELNILNSEILNSGGWGIAHPYSQIITDDTQPNTFSGNTSGDIKSN